MRYLAILLIVMLSVGFFSGLKITRDAMANTGGDYLTEQHFYDYRLISTLGFTEDDVQAFSGASDVQAAEGSFSTDALLTMGDAAVPFKLISLPAEINRSINFISISSSFSSSSTFTFGSKFLDFISIKVAATTINSEVISRSITFLVLRYSKY